MLHTSHGATNLDPAPPSAAGDKCLCQTPLRCRSMPCLACSGQDRHAESAWNTFPRALCVRYLTGSVKTYRSGARTVRRRRWRWSGHWRCGSWRRGRRRTRRCRRRRRPAAGDCGSAGRRACPESRAGPAQHPKGRLKATKILHPELWIQSPVMTAQVGIAYLSIQHLAAGLPYTLDCTSPETEVQPVSSA